MADFENDPFHQAIKQIESGGDQNAVGPRTRSGERALGAMQTMPGTLLDPGYGVRPASNNSPGERARVGHEYLAAMVDKYGGDKRLAAAAYNWGPSNVDEWVASGADPAKLPDETRNYLEKVAPAIEQAPAAPGATRKVNLVKNGVKFTANVPEDWTTEQIQQHFKDNPVPDSYLRGKAADQGKYIDQDTGEIRDYSNVQKFLIGAGKAVNDTITGTNQWVQQALGNADAVKQIAQQTKAETELYNHLDEAPGIHPQDVGQVLAHAAVLFGPGGIVGAAARAGVLEAAQATEDESGDATGRALRGAGTAAAVGALGGGAVLLGRAARALGPANLASMAAPIIAEVATGHGILTAAAIASMRVALGRGGAGGKLGSQFLKMIGKEADNPLNKKLGELVLDGGQPEATRLAASKVLQQRTEEKFAKLAAKQADEARAAEKAAQRLVDEKVAAEAPEALTAAQVARLGGGRAPSAAASRARATDVYEETLPSAGPKFKPGHSRTSGSDIAIPRQSYGVGEPPAAAPWTGARDVAGIKIPNPSAEEITAMLPTTAKPRIRISPDRFQP
jgi:hypothetical protein